MKTGEKLLLASLLWAGTWRFPSENRIKYQLWYYVYTYYLPVLDFVSTEDTSQVLSIKCIHPVEKACVQTCPSMKLILSTNVNHWWTVLQLINLLGQSIRPYNRRQNTTVLFYCVISLDRIITLWFFPFIWVQFCSWFLCLCTVLSSTEPQQFLSGITKVEGLSLTPRVWHVVYLQQHRHYM